MPESINDYLSLTEGKEINDVVGLKPRPTKNRRNLSVVSIRYAFMTNGRLRSAHRALRLDMETY
jgi:hypothetical protein